MCGIALIISGLRINLSSTLFPTSSTTSTPDFKQGYFPILHIDDLKAALRRRGPDHLGCKKVYLQLKTSDQPEDEDEVPLFNVEEATKRMMSCFSETKKVSIISVAEVVRNNDFFLTKSLVELQFVGATLQLRGTTPIRQPLMDTSGNILVYNGEIFGGLHIDNNSNDAETLRDALGRCCTCNCHGPERACRCIEKGKTSAVKLLSTLKGPWALIYWQDSSKILWFGRDAFGRRSLLVHWPTLDDSRFLLSSVSPSATVKGTVDSEAEDQMGDLDFWEELPCGIYSLNLETSEDNGHLVGEVRKHEWEDVVLNELIKWDRNCIEPNAYKTYSDNVTSGVRQSRVHSTDANGIASKLGVKEGCIVDHIDVHVNLPASIPNNDFHSDAIHPSLSLPADKVLTALRDSVMRRTILDPVYLEAVAEAKQKKHVPLAIMFSGGLDSMILAALSDRCLDSCYDIDLLNVSFDGQLAPDRISAREGLQELKRIAPSRRWNLVEIDADLSTLTSETKHVMSLINPSKTYMDLNIGIALWLAAGGDGRISEGSADDHEQYHKQFKYKSNAKILLVGSGADEQCAGYSRHKTKYRLGGWLGLYEEMKLDMQRIWKRNLGRDDRCISDTGKEARFPFLDEDVIKTLLEIPLWEIANLDQPVGRGDKKILREVAQLLGLEAAAFLPKRAIQFGSRIARESNRKNFGSNRAANQASAGSVVINMPTTLNDREA